VALCTINKAQKPVVIIGGGAIDATDELFKFVKTLNLPVVSTMMGLGNFPMSDENYLGMVGIFGNANDVVRNSDLVFAIGTRFNDRILCCFKNGELSKKLIHLDINPNEISKVVPASIGLVGEARTIIGEMNLRLNKFDKNYWLSEAKMLVAKNMPQKRSNLLHSFEVIQEIQKCLKNTVVTTEVGQHQVWASRYLKFDFPRMFVTSGGLGTMGFGFPAAIGACIAKREPVVCIAGDGSFQMSIQEIATCVDYNLPVKIFILNNGYLGMVRQFQEKSCDERYFATKISSPDFIQLAQSYGAMALRVEKYEDIKSAIDKAMTHDGIVLVDFVIEPMEIL
jgi:acetolactate synthase-1/2/3 large subunit